MSAKTRLIFEGENRTARTFGAINRGLSTTRTRLSAVSAAGLTVTRSIRGIGAAVGLLGAGAGLVSLGNRVVIFNDNVAKLSRSLGQPVEQVSALAFAAELAGAEFNSFAKIAREVTTAAADAEAGTKKTADAFDTLRIDAGAFADLDLVGKFGVLTQAISELNDEGVALFAAEGIVGARNAADLLNLAAGGAEGLARAIRDAQASGAVIDAEQAATAEALVDSLARINAGTRKLATEAVTAGGALIGATTTATEDADELAEALKRVREEASSIGVAAKAIEIPKIEPEVTFEEVEENAPLISNSIANAIQAGADEGSKGLVRTLLQEIQTGLIQQLANAISGAISGAATGGGGGGGIGGFFGKLLGFDTGGVVPGPAGSPQLAVVHGGETILPTHRGGAAAGGNTVTINAPLTVNGGSRAEFIAAAKAHEDHVVARVFDMMRRSGRL